MGPSGKLCDVSPVHRRGEQMERERALSAGPRSQRERKRGNRRGGGRGGREKDTIRSFKLLNVISIAKIVRDPRS